MVHDYVELVFGGSREAEAERYLDSASASLRQGHLPGWPLVERAQQAVHQQFWNYCCLYWWESPATAFTRRRGYCVQYNTAASARFEPLTPVRRFGSAIRLLTLVGTALTATAALLNSTISRKPQPRWLHHPLDT